MSKEAVGSLEKLKKTLRLLHFSHVSGLGSCLCSEWCFPIHSFLQKVVVVSCSDLCEHIRLNTYRDKQVTTG